MKGNNNNNTPIAILMIWHDPSSHFRLLFCLTNIKEHSNKSKDEVQYSSIPSAMKPMSHGEKLHVPETPSNSGEFTFFCEDQEPHLIQHSKLNDLTCDGKEESQLDATVMVY
jgi:hypothetical protein